MAPRINLPPATRAILITVLVLSFLYNIARWRQLEFGPDGQQNTPIVPYLTLVPSLFLYYPWTLATATFVEQNIFTVLLNGATIFYGGKYLERAWGSREFVKFIASVSFVPNAVAVPIYVIWAALTGNGLRGLTQICGGVSIQASFLVAFKQLVPEHTVTIMKGLVKMRVKHFPAIFLLLNTVSGLVFGTDTAAILAWLGLLTSWTYLRFYKRQPDLTGTSTNGLGMRGDASDTFTFASFFPDVMQPPVTFVADRIYEALVAMKLCTPFSAEEIATSNENAMARGQAGLPSLLSSSRSAGGFRSMAKREEAERRRALALKALDQRLQAANAARPSSSASSQPPREASPAPAATVSGGQNVLGETNYTPDHS